MNNKWAAQGGVVRGYHGTTTENARSIVANGPRNALNEEGRIGFSLWDEEVALEAIEFAFRRSREAAQRSGFAEADDAGQILYVEALSDGYTEHRGRMEWLVDANQAKVIQVYTPEQMRVMFGGAVHANARVTPAA